MDNNLRKIFPWQNRYPAVCLFIKEESFETFLKCNEVMVMQSDPLTFQFAVLN